MPYDDMDDETEGKGCLTPIVVVASIAVLYLLFGCTQPQPVTVRHTKSGDKDVLEVTFQPGINVRAGNVSLAPLPTMP